MRKHLTDVLILASNYWYSSLDLNQNFRLVGRRATNLPLSDKEYLESLSYLFGLHYLRVDNQQN